MTPPRLLIGNKNYSSWSMRPWIFLRYHGIDFEEIRIPLYTPGSKERILVYSPSGKLPALVDGKTTVWDSFAILEYLAERYQQTQAWPVAASARAVARSICAEMHSGFGALRTQMPMNLRKRFKAREWDADVQQDIVRVQALWQMCRERYARGGPFLFGRFSIADAMYAPVVCRFLSYSVTLGEHADAYSKTMLGLPAMREWHAQAAAEQETLPQFEMAY